ncbi:MAG: type I glyceraldehyde-3-phosphate dehydrogenase [Candidatus Nanoarchaeia archaeon]|nr:type I glyceraldehyde-3-phosphate dehydrogenase [Candidatus Nanoarchaeia archaeon]MDD5741101.1 type I glyceraldehyde-3-phosphate dehydrogenase [Candidatus Nanoarchaeia archaeon]
MKAAVNGLGRIGRLVLKIALERGIDVVAVNDLCDAKNLAYLLKYDSVYGNYDKKVEAGKGFLKINGKTIKVFSEKEPEKLPWKKLGVDVAVESTGFFEDEGYKHIKAGAKKVLISAPSKKCDITIVLGVNDEKLKNQKIISMGSCTTNCLAPVAKVLNDNFGIKKAFMTTVHAYTNDQKILDVPHKKFRRGRGAGVNIIPTTSGATISVAEAIPSLKGKMDGLALRVPVACGSIVDFVTELNKEVTKEQVNTALKKAAEGKMKGILQYTEDEIVSSDVIRNSHTSVVDGLSTMALGNTVKVLAWYDNEYAYSCKMVELIKRMK